MTNALGITLGLLLSTGLAAADPAPSALIRSVTVDPLEPVLVGPIANLWGTYLEEQLAIGPHLSVLFEQSYLGSDNYRTPGGSSTGLRVRLGIATVGLAYWLRRPLEGPFVSVRSEVWLASAENAAHVAATGSQLDVNLQPGWQWAWGHVTLIASASFAYVSGPVRSRDRTVAFPLHGFTGTPHVRVGWAW
jgi:hypothetical protein